jgi:prepilin-type N-terminal cleavage/methylation domain-containing protein
MSKHREHGFSLIELLVVVVIIAILAAIGIPIFLRQQEKGYVAQSQSALKNAATTIQAYGTAKRGDVSDLNGADSQANNVAYGLMVEQGYRKPADVDITVEANDKGVYCITAVHESLDSTHEWETSTYSNSEGAPSPSDTTTC